MATGTSDRVAAQSIAAGRENDALVMEAVLEWGRVMFNAFPPPVRLRIVLLTVFVADQPGQPAGSFHRSFIMQPLESFTFGALLESTAAKTPTPGGGAVASAVGALAAALAGMVVSYSVGKKSLAVHEPALQAASTYLANARSLLLGLGDEDAQAYGVVNELSRLPEGDERRSRELPAALRAAVQIPLATMGACADVLRLMEQLASTTNRQLRSDLGIAAVLACAAAESSLWNVEINVPSLGEGSAIMAEARRCAADCRSRRERVEAACRG